MLQAINRNLLNSSWRISGELSISHFSVAHHLHNLSKSIHSCWIVPHIIEILQNFWLTFKVLLISSSLVFYQKHFWIYIPFMIKWACGKEVNNNYNISISSKWNSIPHPFFCHSLKKKKNLFTVYNNFYRNSVYRSLKNFIVTSSFNWLSFFKACPSFKKNSVSRSISGTQNVKYSYSGHVIWSAKVTFNT